MRNWKGFHSCQTRDIDIFQLGALDVTGFTISQKELGTENVGTGQFIGFKSMTLSQFIKPGLFVSILHFTTTAHCFSSLSLSLSITIKTCCNILQLFYLITAQTLKVPQHYTPMLSPYHPIIYLQGRRVPVITKCSRQ